MKHTFTHSVFLGIALGLILGLNIFVVFKVVLLERSVEELSNALTTAGIQVESQRSVEAAVDTSNWKTYRNEQYGFEFRYPLLGTKEPLLAKEGEISLGGMIEISYYAESSGYREAGYSSDLGFFISDNPEKLPPEEWFSKEVDINDVLARNNIFAKSTVPGGIIYRRTDKPIPMEYSEPLFTTAFLLPASYKYVVSFSLGGQDHNLDLLGYDTDEKRKILENQILSTFKFTK